MKPLKILKSIARKLQFKTAARSPQLTSKADKLRKIKAIIKEDVAFTETESHLNFLNEELRQKYSIVDTENVSSNGYDPFALSCIEKYPDGLLLDCGAGKRSTYYANVVNFEIAAYDTTDVLGVGEELPFKDNSFDAIFSLAVLEHVKDPFKCAAEISRVLKPGGELYCVVPFLQPVHAYPHHYYNMSAEGLKNLFEPYLEVESQEVIASGLPIWAVSWMMNSWADGLSGKTRADFLKMSVADLMASPMSFLDKPFVTELSREKNFELACTTALFAKKPGE